MLEGPCRYETWLIELRQQLWLRGDLQVLTEEMSLADLYANDYTPHEAIALLLAEEQEGCPTDG